VEDAALADELLHEVLSGVSLGRQLQQTLLLLLALAIENNLPHVDVGLFFLQE